MRKGNILIIMLLCSVWITAQQPEIVVNSSYDAYNKIITIILTNTTDKTMRIRNISDPMSSGSNVLFKFFDKNGRVFSDYTAVFLEALAYQKVVYIEPRSNKFFKFYLDNMRPSTISTEIYSVKADCHVYYTIPDKKISNKYLNKTLTIKTKQDLMIYSNYDSYNQIIMITLSNTSDKIMNIRNSGSPVCFGFLNQKNEKLGSGSFLLIQEGKSPATIKINPRSAITLKYPLKEIRKGVNKQTEIVTVETTCSIRYDIPDIKITNGHSGRTLTTKIK
ncbi:hypothetical protein [Bacteroides sp. 519]|uniref:hypothetical protein n=1 Tax=Bacteroides sp. 519 TaxID=2302937 RepID=UPI0013D25359|nr:hypothetical protein [Bacteroides sp. 519]NDV60054.1 hypothetical protein [Bacteroides sp. 519]